MENSNLEFIYSTQILESHLDAFGHVNNAKYFELYEQARWDFISKSGYGLEAILKSKQGPIVLETNCRFKRELVNRELITIKSQTLDLKTKISTMSQTIYKESGEVASTATFTFGFMDLELRKLIEPPVEWLRAIGVD